MIAQVSAAFAARAVPIHSPGRFTPAGRPGDRRLFAIAHSSESSWKLGVSSDSARRMKVWGIHHNPALKVRLISSKDNSITRLSGAFASEMRPDISCRPFTEYRLKNCDAG